MRSVRWNELKKTFRFRLAVLHVLMVAVALTVTFLITLAVARTSALNTGQHHLETSILQARTAYLGGKMEAETDQLPEPLLTRINIRFPNLHIGLVERESQPGGQLYEVIASTGTEWLEILADPNGEIWVADRKPVSELFNMMESALRADDVEELALMLMSPRGIQLAGSRHSDFTPAVQSDLMRTIASDDDLHVLRIGADLYGGLVLYDGNLLFAFTSLEEMERITLWSLEFFFMLMVIFIPLSGWIGYHISRKAMGGVRRVTDSARRVESGNFKERVMEASEGTEIEELVSAFNTMVSHIDVLMHELREVTANIAHDLKTPVTRIRGLLESTTWEEMSMAEREQTLTSAMEECDRIIPLIDSILELSRAEAGMLVLEQEPFDLVEEIRNAHEMFSTLADDHDIRFECRVPGQPVPMMGDRRRIQRIIANLIDNALKFTPQDGRVDVRLEVSVREAVLMVSDNGPGIPQDELENVFKRFYRLDPSRGKPGHGMGLSLVRAFVQAFGGSVTIESDAGKGCTVTLVLPLMPG